MFEITPEVEVCVFVEKQTMMCSKLHLKLKFVYSRAVFLEVMCSKLHLRLKFVYSRAVLLEVMC